MPAYTIAGNLKTVCFHFVPNTQLAAVVLTATAWSTQSGPYLIHYLIQSKIVSGLMPTCGIP